NAHLLLRSCRPVVPWSCGPVVLSPTTADRCHRSSIEVPITAASRHPGIVAAAPGGTQRHPPAPIDTKNEVFTLRILRRDKAPPKKFRQISLGNAKLQLRTCS